MDVRVLIVGWTSEKQLDYEEKVLLEVVEEFGGEAKPAPPRDESNFLSADAVCAWFIGGRFLSEVYYRISRLWAAYRKGFSCYCSITYTSTRRILGIHLSFGSGFEFGHLSRQECLIMSMTRNLNPFGHTSRLAERMT